MALPFLDRERELVRLRRSFDSTGSTLSVLYGRRRVGKSRLVLEAVGGRPSVYYVGDERDASLQREALAREIAPLLPGFDAVVYPEWEPLLDRWWREAPVGAVLVLDEFPFLVRSAPELPSLVQKRIDRPGRLARHLVLSGSSQRMMQGLVLDASAPLYGRAREILRLEPLGAGWIGRALGVRDPVLAVEHHAVWGGIPRYWELAREFGDRGAAIEALVLDPLGVLHREPERLLLDDLEQVTRPASLLALIGQGSHRLSEIAGRLGIPSTSLSRPLATLVELGLVVRVVPFGRSARDTRRTYYRIADPFLRFWNRFVEPNRSRLVAGSIRSVARTIEREWPRFLGPAWEDLARASVPRLDLDSTEWLPAGRWWGPDSEGSPLELDVVSEAADGSGRLLAGEAKLRLDDRDLRRTFQDLERKTARWPLAHGREVVRRVWALEPPAGRRAAGVIAARQVLEALR